MTGTLAIVGRPNVGKSTLFNRLVGKRLALVDDTPGVTRDRRRGEAKLGDLRFDVIDTAGLEEARAGSLESRMREQTDSALTESDVIIFLIDARTGVTPLDSHFAKLMRRSQKPVLLVANKAEGRAGQSGLLDAYQLGFGEPIALSAEHGEGFADLYDALCANLPDADEGGEGARKSESEKSAGPMRIAIVGRPNAGKSTLINKLVGQDRLLTGPEAGITRDSISVDWTWQGREVRLFDTAGLRKKARVQEKLEKLSVADALRAIQFADVVVVLMDATRPLEKQDLQIADLAEREGRAVVIAVNKWDLVADPQAVSIQLRSEVARLLPQLRGVLIPTVSAQTGTGVEKMMRAVAQAYDIWNRRMSTARLNRWLSDALAKHPPPAVAGRRLAIRYVTQPKARPPHFVLFGSRPQKMPESYRRYLVNSLRDAFDLPGVPIRLTFRQSTNPYAPSR